MTNLTAPSSKSRKTSQVKPIQQFIIMFAVLSVWTISMAAPNFSYTGVQAFRQQITLNDVQFESRGALLSWFFTDGAYTGHFGLGMADHDLTTDLQGSTALNSKTKFMWNFEITRRIQMVYFSSGINYFTISGDVEVGDGNETYIYHNRYRLYELPIGTGLSINLGQLALKLGYRQNYYFGKHYYSLVLNQNDTDVQINTEKTSFNDRSAKFYEGEVSLFLSKSIYLNGRYAYNKDSDEDYLSVILGFRL